MKSWLKHPLRATGRLIWLGAELMSAALGFAGKYLLFPENRSLAARASWLQNTCRRVLRVFHVSSETHGPIPTQGLLVCNHLSYLDILVLAACTPAVFVGKREIKYWPVFGWFACMAGTLFIHRESRTHVGEIAWEMQTILEGGALVVLFPEGTSSDGQAVLPFKSSLLEPAARLNHPVTAASIQYELADGDVRNEVCYWGDMWLVPHGINLLGKQTIHASLHFAPPRRCQGTHRKELAKQLHSEVLKLHTSGPP